MKKHRTWDPGACVQVQALLVTVWVPLGRSRHVTSVAQAS